MRQNDARDPAGHKQNRIRKLTLLQLVTATYFMVAGGPFGLEELVGRAGYAGALLILMITPVIWSFPMALMVSELSSALPEEGGFYAWVRRALGRFWGFQEAWLSMTGSLFEMALYPVLFAGYLGRLFPELGQGPWPVGLGLGMMAVCVGWNLLGARAVGEGSVWLSVALLGPFVVLTALLCTHRSADAAAGALASPLAPGDILGGILLAMWNYMGWDNVSTVAGEVQRPQRTYPRAMAIAVAAVAVSYLVPVGAAALAGVGSAVWVTGGWVDVGRIYGGEALALAISIAGMIGAVGTFNALMMSFSRIPMVMAQDGLLPAMFAKRLPHSGAPWVALVVCAVFWALLVPLGFVSLVIVDVLLTGLSILLEFVALVVLRVKEPHLERPYQVPGNVWGAAALGIFPALLIGVTLVRNYDEQLGPVSALAVGTTLIALGPVVYWAQQRVQLRRRTRAAETT